MQFDLLLQNLKGDVKYINLRKRLENNQSMFVYYPPFWTLFNRKLRNIRFNWRSLDYKSGANPDVKPKTPGIYIFVIKPPHSIFDEYNHIMYVGMTEEGLIERLNSGYRTPSGVKLRPHVHRLILDYGRYLMWYYSPLEGYSEKQLKEVETLLIGYFCDPPTNKISQPVQIREANKSKMF